MFVGISPPAPNRTSHHIAATNLFGCGMKIRHQLRLLCCIVCLLCVSRTTGSKHGGERSRDMQWFVGKCTLLGPVFPLATTMTTSWSPFGQPDLWRVAGGQGGA